MAQIHLIGIRHSDRHGSRRLKSALEFEKPKILTFEGSADYSLEEALNTQNKKIIELFTMKNVSKKLIKEYLSMINQWLAFEEKGCLRYARENNIPIYFIDEPIWRQEHKGEMESKLRITLSTISSLETKRIEKMIKKQIGDTCQQDKRDDNYRLAHSIFNNKSYSKMNEQIILEQIDDGLKSGMFGRRDENMAKEIRALAINNNGAKIVHIGGLAHLLEDEKGETLYSRLKEEFNPTRATLLDYD